MTVDNMLLLPAAATCFLATMINIELRRVRHDGVSGWVEWGSILLPLLGLLGTVVVVIRSYQ